MGKIYDLGCAPSAAASSATTLLLWFFLEVHDGRIGYDDSWGHRIHRLNHRHLPGFWLTPRQSRDQFFGSDAWADVAKPNSKADAISRFEIRI